MCKSTIAFIPCMLQKHEGRQKLYGIHNIGSILALDSVAGSIPLELIEGEVLHDLLLRHLGIVNAKAGTLHHKAFADIDGGCLAGVTGILFESKAKQRDILIADC
jgi:hypothetical protein